MITGGGSGGHLNAAIAVIKEIQLHHPQFANNLVFIGGTRGMISDPTPSLESRKIPEIGVRFIGIRSGKLHRRLHPVSIKLLFGVIVGTWDAWKVLRQERPDIVFSTGGYVTVPVVVVAKLLGIKTVIHEQTIVSGLANRIAGRFAHKILISFPDSAPYFNAKKTVLTGNAIQASRLKVRLPSALTEDYREFLETTKRDQSRPFVFITGGGLGSHIINQWVLNNLETLAGQYRVLLQTGENQVHNDYQHLVERLEANSDLKENVYVTRWFGDEIGFIYHEADLVICRPGANTVLELLATNRRAILIPIPWSSGNEQQKNAEYFCKHQTGKILGQDKIDSELLEAMEDILNQPPKESASLVNPSAAKTILAEILKLKPSLD